MRDTRFFPTLTGVTGQQAVELQYVCTVERRKTWYLLPCETNAIVLGCINTALIFISTFAIIRLWVTRIWCGHRVAKRLLMR